jgi:hypothetical protein
LKGSQRQGLPDIKAINLSKLSRCWLRIIQKSNLLPGDEEIDWLLDESTQLCNIVGQSVATASQKRKRYTLALR